MIIKNGELQFAIPRCALAGLNELTKDRFLTLKSYVYAFPLRGRWIAEGKTDEVLNART